MLNQQKLNIAMVCDPITEYTAGSFVSTMRFAEILSRRGHKIVFIAARSPKNYNDNSYHNMKIYRFPSLLLPKTEKKFYISLPAINQVKKIFIAEKINVLSIIIPTPAAVVAAKAAKALGIKIVYHSHTQPENIFLHLPKAVAGAQINRLFYKYLAWIYNKAGAIVFPSEFSQKLLAKLDSNIKTAVISNGVDIAKFKKTETEKFFVKFNLPRQTKNILFVGRLHPEKSVDTLIKALPLILAREPNARLWIAGSGHLQTELEQLAQKLSVADKTVFFGRISDEDLVLIYNACDLFVLPSLAELEGMVVLEAMACGKPILIADAPDSASAYFVNQNGLLFKPKSPRDLAKQALKILTNDNLRREMGEVSFRDSRRYDINQSVQSLEKLYYEILQT
jgi:glycosyltransferase involved in cell wall biosynthesis